MGMLSNLKTLWKAKSLWAGIQQLNAEGYEWKRSLKKMATAIGWVTIAIAVQSVADYFKIPANLDLLFNWLPESIRDNARVLLAPPLIGLFAFLTDWAKNRRNQIVWVLPIEDPTHLQRSGEIPATPQLAAVPVPLSVKPAALIPPAPSKPIEGQE